MHVTVGALPWTARELKRPGKLVDIRSEWDFHKLQEPGEPPCPRPATFATPGPFTFHAAVILTARMPSCQGGRPGAIPGSRTNFSECKFVSHSAHSEFQ